jgi:biopolymer transport protein ExbD
MGRVRAAAGVARVDINMTPMIDVVFQLLTFFLMTFRVATPEGDFALKLPAADAAGRFRGSSSETICVRLAATPAGDLAFLAIDDGPQHTGPAAFAVLHNHVVRMVHLARSAGQHDPEVQIDADDPLRYENIIQTIAAVSGQRDEAGNIVPLVRKVKFAPK